MLAYEPFAPRHRRAPGSMSRRLKGTAHYHRLRRALGRQLRGACSTACQARELDRAELAHQAGVTDQDLRALFAGGRTVSLDTLIRVLDAAGLQIWVRRRLPSDARWAWYPGSSAPGSLYERTLRNVMKLRDAAQAAINRATATTSAVVPKKRRPK